MDACDYIIDKMVQIQCLARINIDNACICRLLATKFIVDHLKRGPPSFLADRYIHFRELLVVSLESPSSKEYLTIAW